MAAYDEGSDASPPAGRRIVMGARPDGTWEAVCHPLEDAMAGASEDERRHFAAQYEGLSRLELMRRLRRAEWNLREAEEALAAERKANREYPPLYRVQELAARMQLVRALTEVPRRRAIPKAELLAALEEPL